MAVHLKIVRECVCSGQAAFQQAHQPGAHGSGCWLRRLLSWQLGTFLPRAMEQGEHGLDQFGILQADIWLVAICGASVSTHTQLLS